ncbi:conserved hypothetical protein [Vibrio phage ICP2]|uniref:Uncharacterized protein 21 n=1 Tax=Vibrio phage ICP2 TaxID=979533 RepID=F1D0V2_9CAUD|nr:hypothetical protein ViPhICP2p21 [Vibrio phage ICP2]ADX87703.1 conserved hypothetical protein [Vibrio phage ICP2]
MRKEFKDSMGRWITQGLFLEKGYKPSSIYTIQDEDRMYKGEKYLSIKRLFIEKYIEDPTEMKFARECLGGWQHWKKIKANQELYAMYEEWKEEAEIQVRSIGVRSAMEMARDGKSFAAAKWLAEAGYDKRGAGRPSKEEIVRETRIASRVKDELEEDYERLLGGMSE